MNNFYNSPNLTKTLFDCGISACGIVRENRREFPSNFKSSGFRNFQRGGMRWMRNGPFLFIQWKDRQVVNVISTCHSGTGSNSITRTVKVDGQWQKKSLSCNSASNYRLQSVYGRSAFRSADWQLQCPAKNNETVEDTFLPPH
ncbi:Uncharacterised protein r2_g4333 [Pycnogonum litorale]